jgi:hypothetical protein
MDFRDSILEKPLSKAALKKKAKKGILSVCVLISLEDLMSLDTDGLNDWADETILAESVSGCLSNITYKVVDTAPEPTDGFFQGGIVLQVTADVSDLI